MVLRSPGALVRACGPLPVLQTKGYLLGLPTDAPWGDGETQGVTGATQNT